MIKEWLAAYQPKSREESAGALREIMQEVALAALARGGFFEKAAFYGGTALRIFHGLDRFSEDLDFSLLKPDADFSLAPYFKGIQTEFTAIGMDISIREKKKTVQSHVESAFLKAETVWNEIVLESVAPQEGVSSLALKVKLEVDRKPPSGFETEEKLLLKPFSFYVKCFSLPDLFAGKMHALLFRKWKNRVKGRDWYDMEWYIRKGIPINLSHFTLRAQETGDWKKKSMSKNEFKRILTDRIDAVSMANIKDDVVRFIPNDELISIWSNAYFKDLAEKIKYE